MNKISVCSDCLMAIENHDLTGIPHDLLPDVLNGLEKLVGYYVYEEDLGFKITKCECCGSKLHGERYLFTELQI